MKRYLLAFAGVLVLALTTPAFAQAHGGHGFGGHAVQAPHGFGGPAIQAPHGFSGPAHINGGYQGYRPAPAPAPVVRYPYSNPGYGRGYNPGYGRGNYPAYGHGEWGRGRGWGNVNAYPDRGWRGGRDNNWYFRNNWRFLYWGPTYRYFGPFYIGPFGVSVFGAYGYPYPYLFPQYYSGAYAYPNPPMGWSISVDFNGVTVVAYWDPYLGGYYYYDPSPGGYGYVLVY